jgi:PAS domain S-box-containing protein
MVLDPDYHILAVNPPALERAGLSEDQAVGRYCFQVSHQSLGPCDSLETPCPVKHTLSSGQPAYAIHQHIDAGGDSHYCNVSSYPVLNQEGQVVRVIEIFRDITQDLNVQVERRTRLIKEDLAQLVREDKLIALGKLVASVAHEINNPIASIYNFSKLIGKSIKEHAPTEAELAVFSKWLDLTVREAQRCGKIVSNLLTFARQQGLEPRKVSLGELLDTILTLVRHRMDLADVDLCLELSDPGLSLWGDYNQLQQCFTNLIFNALEAMPEGGTLTIRSGARDDRQVWVSVSDSGHGIAGQHLAHIFEPFFSTKDQSQGVGLGLSMVHGIIREHGGDIQVASPPGQGATFTVTLPSSAPQTALPPADQEAQA